MIGREKRVLLRHYLEQGLSKAALARHCGVSERTVYRWIAEEQLDREVDDGPVRYGPRRPQPSKLDPYKGIIETRLAGYPALSAVRLFEEIRKAGYEGGYDQVKRPRPGGPAEAAEPGAALRGPSGAPGAGGLRGVQDAVGEAARAGRGAGLLAAEVRPLLRAPDDGGGDGGSGVGVPVFRGRALGVAVRSPHVKRIRPGNRISLSGTARSALPAAKRRSDPAVRNRPGDRLILRDLAHLARTRGTR